MQSWWDTQKDIGRIIVRISSKIWNEEKIRESDERKRVSTVDLERFRQTVEGHGVSQRCSCCAASPKTVGLGKMRVARAN